MKARLALVTTALAAVACSSVQTVRLQPETVDVGPGQRPIAGIQATATSFYFLFVPIPGDVGLDRLVNRMLIVAAKSMGADKVTDVHFHLECPDACLSKFFGTVQGDATGIAVQVTAPAPDPLADDGPEPRRTIGAGVTRPVSRPVTGPVTRQ
jgi:hypothetical protein